MLSVLVLGTTTTTITMNRGEQETLYRQARNLRLHQEIKAQQNSKKPNSKPRHHSYGNIHQIHSATTSFPRHKQGMNLCSTFGDEQAVACDDLVLSVLKSPLRDQSLLSSLSIIGGAESVSDNNVNRMSTVTSLTTTNAALADNAPSPQGVGREYATLQGSEDDLANDDVELAMETTELNSEIHNSKSEHNADLSPYGIKFLRRFKTPKFETHRRVSTPMKRKHNRGRSKSTADILDGVETNATEDGIDEVTIQDGTTNGSKSLSLSICALTD